jgi:PGF-pre-PGF domain-containing protein
MRLIFTGKSRTRISYWVGPATVTVEDISAKVGETIEIYENYVETVRIEDERTIVVSYEEGQSVENVRIRFSPGVRDVNIQTRRLPEKPPEVPLPPAEKGLVCYYLEIETPAPEQVESTTIVFKVPRVWIRTNSIDERTVRLLRYRDGEWAELDTTKLREDDNNVYFSAQVPGLSLFAVTGTTLPTQPVTTLPTQPVPPPGPPLYLWLGAGIVFVIFVLAVVWWRLATTRKKYGRRW